MIEVAGVCGVAFIAGICGWRRKQYFLTRCREPADGYLERYRLESSSEYDLKEKDVIFRLYTKDNPDDPIGARSSEPGKLYDGQIDVSKPIKMIIHGWNGNPDSYFTKTIRTAYLSAHDYNVIIVDWSTESHVMYNKDRRFVKELGAIAAHFIDRLLEETGFDMSQLHIIGHSLGAHVCGVVGLNTKRRVGRITGLDPAKPMFSVDDDDRLCPASASFVDVIHTCGKGLGMYEALGHADFYPNQGTPRQPGCGISAGKRSHERAVDYFAESIMNPNAFIAIKGNRWNDYKRRRSSGTGETTPMGENVSHSARGKFWLRTGKSPPYGLGLDS
ncbi:hypothetical protein GE061_013281 [Apolygus lucorum]|uniref:Uncharacterized protein n=1 Tax=Apolygus lucorum TaxID=248454 RepID=A0A6A4JMW9_APOLU|nr:hypothetical protein GE061_013281 [Apolygus lucorum]